MAEITKLNARVSISMCWWLKYIYLPVIEFMIANDCDIDFEKVSYWCRKGMRIKFLGVYSDSGDRLDRH